MNRKNVNRTMQECLLPKIVSINNNNKLYFHYYNKVLQYCKSYRKSSIKPPLSNKPPLVRGGKKNKNFVFVTFRLPQVN